MISRNSNVNFSYKSTLAITFGEVSHFLDCEFIWRFFELVQYCQSDLIWSDICWDTFKYNSKIGCAFVQGLDLISLSDLNFLH
jgi:hypothetical protein